MRRNGAVPATIAVIDGDCCVGLSADLLERLATEQGVHKATTRDLPWLVATRATGATTVAATMRIAALPGFACSPPAGSAACTGGGQQPRHLRRPHRAGRTPVAVVCAASRRILDIRLTLERLETLGVPVVVNGSDDFPSFYSRTSGLPAPRRVDGAAAIAGLLHANWNVLGLTIGISIANPIPAADEIPAAEISAFIEEALAELGVQGVSGQDVTPFLLKRIVERTDGRSLMANLALVRNNAATAAAIAVEYAKLQA